MASTEQLTRKRKDGSFDLGEVLCPLRDGLVFALVLILAHIVGGLLLLCDARGRGAATHFFIFV